MGCICMPSQETYQGREGDVVLHRGPRLSRRWFLRFSHSDSLISLIKDAFSATRGTRRRECILYQGDQSPYCLLYTILHIVNTRVWRPRGHDRVFVYTVAASLGYSLTEEIDFAAPLCVRIFIGFAKSSHMTFTKWRWEETKWFWFLQRQTADFLVYTYGCVS